MSGKIGVAMVEDYRQYRAKHMLPQREAVEGSCSDDVGGRVGHCGGAVG